MKYLCLICAERVMEHMEPAEAAAHFEEYRALIDELVASGHYVGCNRLQPRETAVTVRVRNGKPITTDGPFAETKEQLGGYFVVEARDMNEAVAIAARIPGARYGSVEVRPVRQLAAGLKDGGKNSSPPCRLRAPPCDQRTNRRAAAGNRQEDPPCVS